MKTLEQASQIKSLMVSLAQKKVEQTPLNWLNPTYEAVNYSKIKVTLSPRQYSDFHIIRKEVKKISGKKTIMDVTGKIYFLLKISY